MTSKPETTFELEVLVGADERLRMDVPAVPRLGERLVLGAGRQFEVVGVAWVLRGANLHPYIDVQEVS